LLSFSLYFFENIQGKKKKINNTKNALRKTLVEEQGKVNQLMF